MDINSLLATITELVIKYGYVGAFIIAIISNMILFLPVPYLAAFFILAGKGINLILLSIIGGLGAAIGKLLSYLVGLSSRYFTSEEKRRRLDALKKISNMTSSYGFLIILLATATPMPDDAILVPFGMMKYDLLKYFSACFLGKTILTMVIISWRKALDTLLTTIGWKLSLVISIIAFLIIIAIVFYVDWEHLLKVLLEEGLKSAFIEFGKAILGLISRFISKVMGLIRVR